MNSYKIVGLKGSHTIAIFDEHILLGDVYKRRHNPKHGGVTIEVQWNMYRIFYILFLIYNPIAKFLMIFGVPSAVLC